MTHDPFWASSSRSKTMLFLVRCDKGVGQTNYPTRRKKGRDDSHLRNTHLRYLCGLNSREMKPLSC